MAFKTYWLWNAQAKFDVHNARKSRNAKEGVAKATQGPVASVIRMVKALTHEQGTYVMMGGDCRSTYKEYFNASWGSVFSSWTVDNDQNAGGAMASLGCVCHLSAMRLGSEMARVQIYVMFAVTH